MMIEEVRTNLDLYRYLVAFDNDQRPTEYARIVSRLPFKVKSLPYLMRVGARVDARL